MKRRLAILLTLCSLIFVSQNYSDTSSLAHPKLQTWVSLTEGVGAGDIRLGTSTASDVETRYGAKYELTKHNEYSYEMKYPDLELSFYYCLKDQKKKIFLIEAHHGATSKGIDIGYSTLQDVFDKYGEPESSDCCDVEPFVYEYKGVQFYVESISKESRDKKSVPPSEMKVVEIDVVPPDKSSNFCDGL
jgi:hypothetical protein